MTLVRETNPMLRRFERNQILATLVMAAAAAVAFRRFDVVLGVIGGGALMATSYRAIKGGVDALVGKAGRRSALLPVKFVGRYALLALAAYVMLICLRAHPLGLLVGATSTVVAVAIEAVGVVRSWSRPGHPR